MPVLPDVVVPGARRSIGVPFCRTSIFSHCFSDALPWCGSLGRRASRRCPVVHYFRAASRMPPLVLVQVPDLSGHSATLSIPEGRPLRCRRSGACPEMGQFLAPPRDGRPGALGYQLLLVIAHYPPLFACPARPGQHDPQGIDRRERTVSAPRCSGRRISPQGGQETPKYRRRGGRPQVTLTALPLICAPLDMADSRLRVADLFRETPARADPGDHLVEQLQQDSTVVYHRQYLCPSSHA